MFYKICTNLTKSQTDDLINSMTPEESSAANEIDVISYDTVENGFMVSYMICSKSEFYRVVCFLRKKDIKFFFTEISNDVILGKIKFEDEYFKSEADKYVKDNISVDYVLDKILELGIDSLTDSDKILLSKS